jgi:hypothetical protein
MFTKKNKTVGPSYKIDNRAMKEFENWLPDDWIHRRLHPDFHIDYLVETVNAGELSGVYFGVQVKGTTILKKSAPPCHRIKSKHLRYFLKKCPFPVFVFLIDVNNRTGNWVFAQQFIKEQRRMMLFAHELLQGKEVRQTIPFGRFSGVVSVPADQIKITGEVGSHRIVSADVPLDCLGTQIRLGPIGHEFTHTKISSVSPAGPGGSNLVIRGTKKTERIMVLLKPKLPLAKAR